MESYDLSQRFFIADAVPAFSVGCRIKMSEVDRIRMAASSIQDGAVRLLLRYKMNTVKEVS